MKEYYENKVAVVTGGASGIGLALCEVLLSFGAKAVILADLNAEKLKTESARLETAYPGRVRGIQTDVTRQESVAAMIRQAAEFGAGQIHLLFNNAGLGLAKAFDETTDADWKFAFDVNFYGALYGIRAVLPIMRAQGGGHIANTCLRYRFCADGISEYVQCHQGRVGRAYLLAPLRALGREYSPFHRHSRDCRHCHLGQGRGRS